MKWDILSKGVRIDMKKVRIEKNTVQETLIVPLYGRKMYSEKFPELYTDSFAKKLCDNLDYDFSELEKKNNSFLYEFGSLEAAMRQLDMIWEIKELSERSGWRLSAVPDFEKLRETGAVFLGTHDFASFGSAPEKGGSTVRRIYRSRWLRSAETPEKLFFYEVEANGFLYRMVRRLVYLQAMAALGFLPGDSLREALESGRPLRAGLAPAAGLTLTNVSYPAWIYDSDETGKQAEIF